MKERYRADPRAALITLRARGRATGLCCKVETGKAIVEAGLHPATGGDGTAACSGDMLLEALVACAGVTLRAVATSIGVELGDVKVTAEGDLDFRGTLGVSKDVPVGFVNIRLKFDIETNAPEEQMATLLKLTGRVLCRFADASHSADCLRSDYPGGGSCSHSANVPSSMHSP